MIFEELATTTNALKELKKKMDLHTNIDLQNNTDTKYRIVLKQAEKFISIIEFLSANKNIQKNEDILKSALFLIDTLEGTIKTGLALPDEVTKAEVHFKTLQVDMKKEWAKQYVNLTDSTISTLEVIKSIDPENVETCLQKMKGASNWELDITQYEKMYEGISEAKQLIEKLGLDDEIKTFLQKTNSNKATLRDLNDKVLKWIHNKKLENKISLSFLRG